MNGQYFKMFKGVCSALYILWGIVLVSCASSKKTVTREKVSTGDALKDRFAGGYTYGKKGGTARSQSDKESDFSRKSFGGVNDFEGKKYKGETYATERWGGKSNYNSNQYQGGTDTNFINKSPAFAQHQADLKKGTWNDSNYKTEGFKTSSAREGGNKSVNTSVSNHADKDKVIDPIILPWKSQNAMSISETKSMMGNSGN